MPYSVKLSELELRLLALVPRDGTAVSSSDLVGRYFGDAPPLNARTLIVGRLTGIGKKLDALGHDLVLNKSGRAGPHPARFWLTPRNK